MVNFFKGVVQLDYLTFLHKIIDGDFEAAIENMFY